MQSKISIIVPVYNVEKYLDRCVQSLIDQTLGDIEIILVDDGSSDRCPVMCDEWLRKDNRIKVVHKKNEGLGLACNSGLDVATGEYVAFCDSDDFVDKEMYETLYRAAVENMADAVFSGIKTIDQDGNVHPMSGPRRFEVINDTRKIHDYLLGMIASSPSSSIEREVQMSAKIVLYRHEFLEMNKIRFESERVFISEDLIWHIDILGQAKTVVTVPQAFYYYYNNTASISKRIRTDRFPFFKSVRQEVIRRATGYGVSEEVVRRADRMFIGYSRHYIGQICRSGLPYGKRRELIRDICCDPIWCEIRESYPIGRMPWMHRIMLYMMKYNLFHLINLVYKIK